MGVIIMSKIAVAVYGHEGGEVSDLCDLNSLIYAVLSFTNTENTLSLNALQIHAENGGDLMQKLETSLTEKNAYIKSGTNAMLRVHLLPSSIKELMFDCNDDWFEFEKLYANTSASKYELTVEFNLSDSGFESAYIGEGEYMRDGGLFIPVPENELDNESTCTQYRQIGPNGGKFYVEDVYRGSGIPEEGFDPLTELHRMPENMADLPDSQSVASKASSTEYTAIVPFVAEAEEFTPISELIAMANNNNDGHHPIVQVGIFGANNAGGIALEQQAADVEQEEDAQDVQQQATARSSWV